MLVGLKFSPSSSYFARCYVGLPLCTMVLAAPIALVLASTGTSAASATLDLVGIDKEISDLSGSNADTVTNSGPSDASVLVTGGTSTTFSGTIEDGAAKTGLTLRKSDPTAGLTLDGTNTYSGGTIIESGDLSFGGATALGNGRVTLNGGDLRSQTTTTLTNDLAFGVAAGSVIAEDGTELTIAGNVFNTGQAVLGEAGSTGTIVLGGALYNNDFASTVTMEGGTVKVGNAVSAANALSNLSGVTVGADATLDLNAVDVTVTDLSGAGTIVNNLTGAANLIVNGTDNTEFSGAIGGGTERIGLELNKADADDTFALTGASSITGATQINRGTLRVGGSSSLSATSVQTDGSLILENGATVGSLASIGTVDVTGATITGDALINSALLDVGAGLTTFAADLTIGGALRLEFGGTTPGTFSQLSIDGDFDILGSLLDINTFAGFSFAKGQFFDIISVDGDVFGGVLSDGFVGLSEGSLIAGFQEDLFITYRAGDGNDIALYTTDEPKPPSVPLPASIPALLSGMGALAALRWRRKTR